MNQLAVYLTGGQLSFPTTIFITDLNKAPAPLAGYLKVREIEPPLNILEALTGLKSLTRHSLVNGK